MKQTSIDFLSPVSTIFVLALIAAAIMAYLSVRLSSGSANTLSKRWPIYVLRGLFLATLAAVLFNPVRVTERSGAIEPAQVFFLLDASQSMAIGDESNTRWDEAIRKIQTATQSAYQTAATEVNLFKFGRRLKAVQSPESIGLTDALADDGRGVTFAQKNDDENSNPDADDEELNALANEPDTQLMVALQQVTNRFGRKPPAAVFVFSDGRARDTARTQKVSESFTKLGVPIHTAPVGNVSGDGDIAVISLVLPATARKQSEVVAQAFLRSYGFEGKRVKVELSSIDENQKKVKRLASVPVVLQSGFQTVPISFRTDAQTQLLQVAVTEQPKEISLDNNRFDSEIIISREKIRVLYYEGSRMPTIPTQVNGQIVLRGPTTPLQQALQDDPDIECVPVQVSTDMLSSSVSINGTFPNSAADLSAFDAVILSDVPRKTFSQKQLKWIETWVRQRGGGLCMLGGQKSFSAGGWKDTPMQQILPVQIEEDYDWRGDVRVKMGIDTTQKIHPIFKLASDDRANRDLLKGFPDFSGGNVRLLPKPDLAQVVGVGKPGGTVEVAQPAPTAASPLFSSQGIRNLFAAKSQRPAKGPDVLVPDQFASITVGKYGNGRSMAMAVPVTGPAAEEFLKWGEKPGSNNYYAQFWRNTIYWLTERSSVGRRRLAFQCDKRYYGPDETITLSGNAFSETSKRTSSYRLVGMIEPQSFEGIESDFSVVRWPNNVPREAEGDSPFVMWGEEFEIPVTKVGGVDQYQIELPVAESLPSGVANQSLRIELTAYEDDSQVDSTSVPIQILHDPFEQQNPFPNHELLTDLANASGGQVLEDDEAIADVLKSLPVVHGPSEFSRAPIWSRWWVMALLLAFISGEWCYRRWIGLA